MVEKQSLFNISANCQDLSVRKILAPSQVLYLLNWRWCQMS